MRNIVIFGDTQFAESVYKIIAYEGVDRVVAFTQEQRFITRQSISGVPVLAFEKLGESMFGENFSILVALGYSKMNDLRSKIVELCKSRGYFVASYISQRAVVYSDIMEQGVIVFPGTFIGTDCVIGQGCIFVSSACLTHDNHVGEYSYVSGGATLGGFVEVGRHCFLGLNSTYRDGIKIADYSLIGCGANVLHNISTRGGVFVGNPARPLPRSSLETDI